MRRKKEQVVIRWEKGDRRDGERRERRIGKEGVTKA
jgi:hypothetical protein